MKCEIFKLWAKLPDGIRRKPLDLQIAILLIMTSFAGADFRLFEPFGFLFIDFPLSQIIQSVCSVYLLIGSLLLIYGLFTHHRHRRILSYCKSEIWGWRLILSASGALFIAEFFFGLIPGVSLGSLIWLLQFIVATLKLFQYYNERLKEQRLWSS